MSDPKDAELIAALEWLGKELGDLRRELLAAREALDNAGECLASMERRASKRLADARAGDRT